MIVSHLLSCFSISFDVTSHIFLIDLEELLYIDGIALLSISMVFCIGFLKCQILILIALSSFLHLHHRKFVDSIMSQGLF